MNKKELFKKYSINESHNVWDDSIDNWSSVEVYRVMHDGNLPPSDDMSVIWVYDFLKKIHDDNECGIKIVIGRKDGGSLFLTAKRMMCKFAEEIVIELNKKGVK